ncbi:MAG: hypothetical protein ACI8ZM_000431 [Crocinitomix sp.]|jgi:hypothetical protein
MIIGLSLITATTSFGQAFQKTITNPNFDFNHYSIETLPSAGGGYVCAGTLFGSGNNNMHIFRTDLSGNMLWEKVIDQSNDDRCLDLAIDPSGAIIITGYTTPGLANEPELYIAKLSPAGNISGDNSLSGYPASAGTNVVYSGSTNSYIVGGFYSNTLNGYPLTGNKALLVEFSASLGLNNYIEIGGGINQHSSINDIAVTPAGYFITGSIGISGFGEEQGVLAMMLDNSFGLIGDVSFESTNTQHAGVSVVFNQVDDAVYLMSNNSNGHNPQITLIKDVTSAPILAGEYLLNLDPSWGDYNAAGFQLRQAPWNANNLVACGYFKEFPDPNGNSSTTPWITEFDKGTGANVNCATWPNSAQSFHAHGGGILSTFEDEHPYIYNQEILTPRADGQGFVFVGPTRIGARFGIDLVTMHQGWGMPCYNNYNYSVLTAPSVTVPTFVSNLPITDAPVGAVAQNMNSTWLIHCIAMASSASPVVDEGSENDSSPYGTAAGIITDSEIPSFEIAPNPFSNAFIVSLNGENIDGRISVLNSIGQVVFQSGPINGAFVRTEINSAQFEKGIYIITYSNAYGLQKTEKIVKI